jgi:hypothetical protein
MKKTILLTFLSLALVASAYAQKTEAAKELYFQTGKYALSAAQKQELDVFYSKIEAQATIEVQGCADNTGKSAAANEKIAMLRAEAAQKYLVEKGVAPSKIILLPAQILAVEAGKNQRKVVISQPIISKNNQLTDNKKGEAADDELTLAEAGGLQDMAYFYDYWLKDLRRIHVIDHSQSQLLSCEKGAIIHIPATIFVDAKGLPAQGKVTLTIQEAHTYGDMILQNWATMAQGKALETGGMLYIEAQDERGEKLSILAGKNIQISMPNANAGKAGMQVFEGKKDSSTNQIDWHATEELVNSAANENKLSSLQNPFTVYVRRGATKENEFKSMSVMIENYKTFAEPLKVQPQPKPQYPKPAPISTVVNDKIKLQQKEAQKVYAQELKKYEQGQRVFEQEVADYVKYENNLRKQLQLLPTWAIDFNVSSYSTEINAARIYVANLGNPKQLNKCRNYIDSEYAKAIKKDTAFIGYYEATEVQIENLAISKADRKMVDKLSKTFSAANFGTTNLPLSQVEIEGRQNQILGKEFRDEVVEKANLLLAKEVWTEDDCYLAQLLCNSIKDAPIFGETKGKIATLAQFLIMQQQPLPTVKASFDSLDMAYSNLQAQKLKHGFLSTNEVFDMYANIMNINKLGYINCDRFIDNINGGACIEILTDSKRHTSKNTVVYVLFEDIQSMIGTQVSPNQTFRSQPLPLNRRVKIVGIYAEGTNIEVFVAAGAVREFAAKGFNPKFEPKTLEEVKQLMSSL